PYREESHRQLMRIHTRKHAPHLALAQYQKLQRVLQGEFGSEPSQETRTLVQQITAGLFDAFEGVERNRKQEGKGEIESLTDSPAQSSPISRISSHPPTQSLQPSNAQAVRPDLSEVPESGPFYGRIQERELLAKWLLHDHCRVVAILGIGG